MAAVIELGIAIGIGAVTGLVVSLAIHMPSIVIDLHRHGRDNHLCRDPKCKTCGGPVGGRFV